jgi:hypothetical protein
MTTDQLTKMPDGCSVCNDGGHAHHLLHLHGRCHMHAPLRLAYRRTGVDRGIIFVTCYLPDCSRPVASFGARGVPDVAPAKPAHACELCGDNDPHAFRKTAVNAHHDFTAPFRLELHTHDDGQRRLHVFCYVEECSRTFAVLALEDKAARP